ncbi:MAG: molecular chaperone DnaJ, partial [Planctomycetes bacterium]|nr:molecular chaperone DnaJ [Planctomycetota bacterium]
VDLADVLNGIKRPITLRRAVPCEPCGGSGAKSGTRPERCSLCEGHGEVLQSHGFFNVRTTCPQCGGAGSKIRSPCPSCGGTGRTLRSGELEIHVPAGVEDGMQLRLEGQGEAGGGGGPPGDLYCVIRVREHPIFTRKGDDLHCAVPITFPQAALGAQVEVPTLQAITKMRVPPGSQPGQTLRLRGQGIPNVRGYGRGDLLVHLELEVPGKMTRRQEEILQEFAKIEEKNIGPQRKGFLDRLKGMFE